jgi:hypothetical protein
VQRQSLGSGAARALVILFAVTVSHASAQGGWDGGSSTGSGGSSSSSSTGGPEGVGVVTPPPCNVTSGSSSSVNPVSSGGASVARPAAAARGGVTGGGAIPGVGGATGAKKPAGGAGRTATRWGGEMRSPTVAATLDIRWIESAWPAEQRAGYAPSMRPLRALLDQSSKQAAMVYVYDARVARCKKLASESSMFGSDDVVALTGLVSCFSIAAEEAEIASFKSAIGTKLPALVFYDANGETMQVLEGASINADDVLGALEKTLASSYGLDAKAHAAKVREVLDRLDKAEDACFEAAARVRDAQSRASAKKADAGAAARLAEARARFSATRKALELAQLERAKLLKPARVEREKAVAAR